MHRKYNLAPLILVVVIVLGLTLLMVDVDAQAQIIFSSNREGNLEIYVMNADGLRQVRRLTKNGGDDLEPAWFDPTFAVEVAPFAAAPAGEKLTIWGWLKRVDR